MKNILLFILIFVMFVPPVQAHVDVIIFDGFENHQSDILVQDHEFDNHQLDDDREKSSEHHHHCTFLGVTNAIVLQEFNYEIAEFLQKRKRILFNKTLHTSNYLNGIFQPPRTC